MSFIAHIAVTTMAIQSLLLLWFKARPLARLRAMAEALPQPWCELMSCQICLSVWIGILVAVVGYLYRPFGECILASLCAVSLVHLWNHKL